MPDKTPEVTILEEPQVSANAIIAPEKVPNTLVEFHQKLFNLQQSIDPIVKDSDNPFFHSKYFDINKILETLMPKLAAQGLFLLQPIRIVDGANCLVTMVVDSESDRFWESTIKLPDFAKPQEMGSAITYYRRYALQTLLGLAAEDDDGNATNPPKAPVAAKTPPVTPQTVQNAQTTAPANQTQPKPAYKPTGTAGYKVCPNCGKEHGGAFPKCKECYFAEKNGTPVAQTKTIINDREPPDFVH